MDNNLQDPGKIASSPDNSGTEEIYIDNGTIYVTLSLSLAPFFTENIEKNFYKLRLNTNWGDFLKYKEPTYKITKKVINDLRKKNISDSILQDLGKIRESIKLTEKSYEKLRKAGLLQNLL
jgi:putative cell wall-binding protein